MSVPRIAPLRLGHLVPERKPVVIHRDNPLWLALADDDPRRETTPEVVDVILQGYVFGPRCPGVIKSELASIEEAFLKVVRESSAQVSEGDEAAGAVHYVVAWHTFLRETIQVLVPGLTSGEADVLAAVTSGSEGPGTDLLRYLGVWTERDAATEAEGGGSPEVVGEEPQPTTALSSPISPPSTD